MTRDETRGEIDLSLPIEGIEQRGTNLLGVGGQVIERLAAIARNAGWRYIEVASEIERYRSVQDATHPLTVAFPVGRPNLLQHPMDGIGIGEDVVGRLPIGVLVGAPKTRQPDRRRIGERTAEVSPVSARHDRLWIIAEKRLSKRRVI